MKPCLLKLHMEHYKTLWQCPGILKYLGNKTKYNIMVNLLSCSDCRKQQPVSQSCWTRHI